jgi:hypothetical protein
MNKSTSGWILKVYHTLWKGPSPYYSIFLPYILIPIKNNESKAVKNTIFSTIATINYTTLKNKSQLFLFNDVRIHVTFVSFVKGNTI